MLIDEVRLEAAEELAVREDSVRSDLVKAVHQQ